MREKKIIYYEPIGNSSHDYADFSRNIRLICWLKCCVLCSHYLSVDHSLHELIFLVRSFLSYRLRNKTIEDCNFWQEENIDYAIHVQKDIQTCGVFMLKVCRRTVSEF